MEKMEPSYTVGGNVNWCSTLKNSMEVPQKTKKRERERSHWEKGSIKIETFNLASILTKESIFFKKMYMFMFYC